ncbi:Kelch repeat-containing protein [Nocardia sp. CA-128927]|uniref:Kelch repeat-containing protein n=1 Tax=Nocardia sp. CA-128927 TaxID=3239975 RepID=UPI003D97196C
MWQYDPKTNKLTERARMPLQRIRGATGAAVRDGKIYVAGGQRDYLAFGYFDECPATDTWTALPDLPNPREHLGAAIVGDKFYAVGGRFVVQPAFIRPTDVFDFSKGSWSTIALIPHGRGGLAVVPIGDMIYAIGGAGIGPSFTDNEVLDTRSLRWSTREPMKRGRHGIQGVAADGKIYIVGGASYSVYLPEADMQVYVP